MDKRILMLIAGAWLIAFSIFFYKKVYGNSMPKPVYSVSFSDNQTSTGKEETFEDKTESATKWKWDFGDGQYSFDRKATHIYTTPGEYQITLTAYGSFGYVTDNSKTVNVIPASLPAPKPESPNVEIIGSVNVNQKVVTTFSSSVNADSYEWRVSGEEQYENRTWNTKEINLSFANPGAKILSLKLNNNGAYCSKNIIVKAKEQQPIKRKQASPKQKNSQPENDWKNDF